MRLRELRDRLELELLQLGEEQCECVLKLKEQHAAQVPESGRGGEGEQQLEIINIEDFMGHLSCDKFCVNSLSIKEKNIKLPTLTGPAKL